MWTVATLILIDPRIRSIEIRASSDCAGRPSLAGGDALWVACHGHRRI